MRSLILTTLVFLLHLAPGAHSDPCLHDLLDKDCNPLTVLQPFFDLSWFTQASWFVHQMKPSSHLPFNSRFCPVMTFNPSNLLSVRQPRYAVDLYANTNSPGGINAIRNSLPLCLSQPAVLRPAKLTWGSCLLPAELGRDFWVVAYSKNGTLGEWAVVVEGQPSVRVPGVCAAFFRCGMLPLQGIYIMTRSPERNENDLALAYAAAVTAGVCMGQVVDTVHTGCSYAGTQIRS